MSQHICKNVLPSNYLNNEKIIKFINTNLYNIYLKKGIAKIYTPLNIETITLENLVYQTDDKNKEYLDKHEIDWQKDLIHIPIKFWNKDKIHTELLNKLTKLDLIRVGRIQDGTVSDILIGNYIMPTSFVLSGSVISNYELNKLIKYYNREPIKYLTKSKKQNGMKYSKNGKYADYLPFVPMGRNDKGGLYFVMTEYISYMNTYVADILPDNEGWTQFQGDIFKTNIYHLSNIRKR